MRNSFWSLNDASVLNLRPRVDSLSVFFEDNSAKSWGRFVILLKRTRMVICKCTMYCLYQRFRSVGTDHMVNSLGTVKSVKVEGVFIFFGRKSLRVNLSF